MPVKIRATTIVVVRRNGQVAIAGDGQVSLGQQIVKQAARKIRRLGKGSVLAGFAGSGADAISLLDKFEQKLEKYSQNLGRAAVELAREWRTDKVLRRLEAMLLVADRESTFLISGQGDVIEPDDDACAIGSGGSSALAAARALLAHTEMTAGEIASESLKIAGQICIYTNGNVSLEVLERNAE